LFPKIQEALLSCTGDRHWHRLPVASRPWRPSAATWMWLWAPALAVSAGAGAGKNGHRGPCQAQLFCDPINESACLFNCATSSEVMLSVEKMNAVILARSGHSPHSNSALGTVFAVAMKENIVLERE